MGKSQDYSAQLILLNINKKRPSHHQKRGKTERKRGKNITKKAHLQYANIKLYTDRGKTKNQTSKLNTPNVKDK